MTYGVDAALTKPSTGNYQAAVTVNASGTWWWRWEASGNFTGADEGTVSVQPSAFA